MPSLLSRLRGSIGAPAGSSVSVGRPSASSTGTRCDCPLASTTVSVWITGFTGCTCQSSADPSADSSTTMPARIENRIGGSGSLLPSHSIQSSTLRGRAPGAALVAGELIVSIHEQDFRSLPVGRVQPW